MILNNLLTKSIFLKHFTLHNLTQDQILLNEAQVTQQVFPSTAMALRVAKITKFVAPTSVTYRAVC